jgi:hypothetical protein
MNEFFNHLQIKVGVLVPNERIDSWIYNIIAKLSQNSSIDLKVIKGNIFDKRFRQNRGKNWIIRLHERIDAILYRGRFGYNQKMNLEELFGEGALTSLSDWDKQKIGGNKNGLMPDFDLVIDFLKFQNTEKVFKSTTYGVLSFVPTNSNIEGENYTAYKEILTRNPEVAAKVVIRKGSGPALVINNSSVSLFSNSIHINRDRIYSLSALLIPRIIDGILKDGVSFIESSVSKSGNKIDPKVEMLFPPSIAESIFNLLKIIYSSVVKRFFLEEIGKWHLLYNENNDQKPYPVKFKNYLELKAPKGSFWADPCVIKHKSSTYIFVEEFVYSTGVGHISLLIRNKNGGFNSPIPVLKKPYHLSYPFVFSFGGEFYMVPETRAVGSIQLYRGDPFPECWSYVKDLMTNIEATDTTLFHHDNKWWLFTSKVELQNKELVHTELFLYYADDLLTEKWTSHPCNPIVNDISKSRSAGRIFEHEGTLIRPSQDCTGGYGKAINFNEITILNIHDYQERLLTRIKPDWDKQLSGMHTFSQDGNFCVIDVCTPRVRFFK